MKLELEDRFKTMFDDAMQAHVERELQWWKNERRGRWVVLEPGPGRLLKNASRDMREYVDAIMPQRGRRFRSLSRARAFAKAIGGEVRRWHRELPRYIGGRKYMAKWIYETNPWKRATAQGLMLPLAVLEDLS